MALVVYSAIVLVAIRSAWDVSLYAELWASGLSTIAAITVAFATLFALTLGRRERMPWAGFAVFGWVHYVQNIFYFVKLYPDEIFSYYIEKLRETGAWHGNPEIFDIIIS
jgi:hypothetical protein